MKFLSQTVLFSNEKIADRVFDYATDKTTGLPQWVLDYHAEVMEKEERPEYMISTFQAKGMNWLGRLIGAKNSEDFFISSSELGFFFFFFFSLSFFVWDNRQLLVAYVIMFVIIIATLLSFPMEYAVPLPYSIHIGNRVTSDENLCGGSGGRPGWAVYNALWAGIVLLTGRPGGAGLCPYEAGACRIMFVFPDKQLKIRLVFRERLMTKLAKSLKLASTSASVLWHGLIVSDRTGR